MASIVDEERQPGSDNELLRCEQRVGYHFTDKSLLRGALTHASGAQHRLGSNERLEFLGDAILGYIICEMLYERFPSLLEGDLTKIKSVVVSRQNCAKVSRSLGLDEFMILGKGMTTNPTIPSSLHAGVLESMVAAICLDGGMEAARDFVRRFMTARIDSAAGGDHGGNYKSLLQQVVQRDHATTPTYLLLDEKGPDHSKCFKMSAMFNGRRFSPAWGRNKKEAEQRAALNALSELAGEEVPFPCD